MSSQKIRQWKDVMLIVLEDGTELPQYVIIQTENLSTEQMPTGLTISCQN